MTVKIPKSVFYARPGLDVAIAEHAEQVRHWRAHMKRVEEDAANDKIAPADKHQEYGRPRSSELVMSAVDGQGNVAYEIEDDNDATLRLKKLRLMNQITEAEMLAITALLPVGRRRWFELEERRIQEEDRQRATTIIAERGLMEKLVGKPFDLAAAVRDARSKQDDKHLAAMSDLRAKAAAIERRAAKAMHDVEDLTDETIKAWVMPDLTGAQS